MILSDPNPGFKVTGYLKVEYLANGVRVFNCTKHSCRSLGATEHVQKIVGRRWIFLLKVQEGVLHQWWKLSQTALVFVETSTQTYSLSEEGFDYNYGRLKSSASHASRENTLLRCGKIPKWPRHLQRHRWARLTGLGGRRSMHVSIYSLVYNGRRRRRRRRACLRDFKHIAYISRNSWITVSVS